MFVTQTGVNERSETVKCGTTSDTDNYFRDSLAEPAKRNQGLKYHTGGGSDLGVLSTPLNKPEKQILSLNVQGIPKTWDAPQVVSFPGRGQVKWFIRAFPPAGSPDEVTPLCTWRYADQHDETLQVYVSKVTGPSQEKFFQRWTHTHIGVIPETVFWFRWWKDSPPESADNERGRSRSPQPRKTQLDPPSGEPSQAPAKELELNEIQNILQQGGQETNQGGTGDCGFRSIAAALAQDGKTILTEEESRQT